MPTNPKATRVQRPGPKEQEESLARSFGLLNHPGMRPVSVREMDEAIGRFHAEEDERVRTKAHPQPADGSIQDLFGMLRRTDIPPRTLEEMREGMIDFLVQEDERIKRGKDPEDQSS